MRVWSDEHKKALALEEEVKQLRLTPAQLKIHPIELRRNDPTSGNKRDVFIQTKVELITPIEVDVTGCTLEFSKDGVVEEMEAGNDVSEWVLYIDSSFESEPMRPLPKMLRSGRGEEGWLHFLTDKKNYELESGRLTLTVRTSRGDANRQIPCEAGYWNPRRSTVVMPRIDLSDLRG